MTRAGGWCRSLRGSTSERFTNPGAPRSPALLLLPSKTKSMGEWTNPLPHFLIRSWRRSEIKRLFQLVHSLPKLRADLGLDRSPRRRMFRLPLEIKRARRGGDLALDFGQIGRINGIHDAGRGGVFRRCVDQTGRRVFVLVKEGAAEDYLAAQAAAVAAAPLVRLPAVENPVR